MRHQPRIVATAILTAAIAGAETLSAQTPSGTPPRSAPRQLAPGLSEKPFSRLFDQQMSDTTAAARARMRENFTRPNSARRFICGTPVLPADPTIDRRSVIPPPATGTRFTMRVFPPVCR
jgi:hypothetical protein